MLSNDGLSLAAAALALAAFGTAAPRLQTRLHGAAGVAVAALFAIDLARWERAATALVVAHATVASMRTWRGVARSGRTAIRHAAIGVGAATAPPLVVLAGAVALRATGPLVDALSIALGPAPLAWLVLEPLGVVTLVLACDGLRTRSTRTPALGYGITAVMGVLVCARIARIASMATLPVETAWSEAPALLNALKLDAHEPLYGPPARLDSYTYSPLLDLLHHALLTPVHLELSLTAHRALVVGEQLGAFAILAWAIGPTLAQAGWGRVWIGMALLAAAFVNMLAACVHPDHLVLLAFAVAVALITAEARWNRFAWGAALLLVTPFAAAAKLTGVGMGAGLAAIFLLERRWRACAIVVASLGLAALTVPLFDATVGNYRFYAIEVQRTHTIEWRKLWTLPTTPYGLAVLGAGALVAYGRWAQRSARRERGSAAARVAVLTATCAVASLPAWLKYAGRDNNLTLLAVGLTCGWLLEMAERTAGDRPSWHPWLAPAAAVFALTAFAPPSLPLVGEARAAKLDDVARVERVVREDDARGGRTLLLASTAEWIGAGHRDVPGDRYQSAVELAFGGWPEGKLLASRLADGRYDTVIAPANELRLESTPVGAFDADLRAALEPRYAIEGEDSFASIGAHQETIILRRIR